MSERIKAYKKKYFQKNKKRIYKYRKANPILKEKRLAYHIKSKYGITLEEFHHYLLIGQCKCWICGVKFDESNRATKPMVDHNHETGEVRGILCHNCNVGLGLFKENPEILISALQYLEEKDGTQIGKY